MTNILNEELLIATIANMLYGCKHVAVGTSSPIPGGACLLAKQISNDEMKVSILGSRKNTFWSDGSKELFDCAAQGRIDAFFLSGAQIDGEANVNLVGTGPYQKPKNRFPGSFGSPYLYFLVPQIILFRADHDPRVLVQKVDFVSAPGFTPPNAHRIGGPKALVTSKAVFRFHPKKIRFSLMSTHPGVSVEEVIKSTGFVFDLDENLKQTPLPNAKTIETIRGPIARDLMEIYPQFVQNLWHLSN